MKPLMALAILFLSCNTNVLLSQNWDEVVKAVASDRAANDMFGYSVSISGDYAIVGAKQFSFPKSRNSYSCKRLATIN